MRKILSSTLLLASCQFIFGQSYLPISGGKLSSNLSINATDASWAEGLLVIKPTGWGGIRFSRTDPSLSANYNGNWAIGYNYYTGNDFSISSNYNGTQYDYLLHISASSRNVGIGTPSPLYKFQVQKTDANPAIMIGGNVAGSPRLQVYGLDANPNAWMGLGTDMGGGPYEHSIYYPSSSYNGKLTFGTYDGSSFSQKAVLSANGSLGIGTPSPIYKLQVQKTDSNPAIMIGGNAAGSPRLQVYGLDANPNAWMGLGTDMGGGPYEHSIYFPSSSVNGKLTFGTYDGSSYSQKVTLSAIGQLGIGTGSPLGNIHIEANSINQYGHLIVNHSNSGGIGGELSINNFGGGTNASSVLAFGVDNSTLFDGSGNNNSNAEIRAINKNGINNATDLLFSTWSGSSENVNMTISSSGNIGIGTQSPSEKLSVNGNIRAQKLIVSQSGWSDYVFDKKYKLRSISALSKYIDTNNHLPDMPTTKEVIENGVNIGENQSLLLKKIEELTLYIIELKKDNELLKKHVTKIENKMLSHKLSF